VLNESFTVIGVRDSDGQGEVVTVKEVLDERRVLVYGRADEERVVELAEALRSVKLRSGDALLLDLRSNLLTEKLIRQEAEELILEEVPDISYADVGGLDAQIEAITDAVELPYLHRALFNDYDLPAPKGILLYGPPGCGKTLIAKAVANSLSQKVGELTGNRNVRSYFLNIKGPELLNKYVGETERQIRVVFQRAREKAERACRSSSFSTRWTPCFGPVAPGLAQTWSRRSFPNFSPRSTASSRYATSSSSGHEPRGLDRSGNIAPGPARRQDQDRATRR